MTEEEAPIGVVGVGIRVGPFVVAPVIPAPLKNARLQGHCVEAHEEDAQTETGLEGAMRPQAMSCNNKKK